MTIIQKTSFTALAVFARAFGAEPDESIVKDVSVSYSNTGATLSFTATDNSGTVLLLL